MYVVAVNEISSFVLLIVQGKMHNVQKLIRLQGILA